MSKSLTDSSKILSGSFNGEIISWDLIKWKSLYKIDCFDGVIKDLTC